MARVKKIKNRGELEWIKDVPSALRRINREMIMLENQRRTTIFRSDYIIVNEGMRKLYNTIARLLEIQSKGRKINTPQKEEDFQYVSTSLVNHP